MSKFWKKNPPRLLKEILSKQVLLVATPKVVVAPLLHAKLTSLTAIATCPVPLLAQANFVPTMEAPVPHKRLPTLLSPTDSTTSTQSAARINQPLATRSATLSKLAPGLSTSVVRSQSRSDTTSTPVTASRPVRRPTRVTTERRRESSATTLPKLICLVSARTTATTPSDE